MICIAPPAHSGGDSLGTPVTHLLQDMLGGRGESLLWEGAAPAPTPASPLSPNTRQLESHQWVAEWASVCWSWKQDFDPSGAVSLSRSGSNCTWRRLWLPWACSTSAPQGTLKDPVPARGSSSDAGTFTSWGCKHAGARWVHAGGSSQHCILPEKSEVELFIGREKKWFSHDSFN